MGCAVPEWLCSEINSVYISFFAVPELGIFADSVLIFVIEMLAGASSKE